MDKIRVLMTGPMPPSVGGMATVLSDLGASKLATQVDLVFFNTAKTTKEGRNIIEAVLSKSQLWLEWVRLLKANPRTIAHIHTCSGFTFFLDGILICLAKLSFVPVVLHVHGAKFDNFLDGLNPLLLLVVRWLFWRCDKVIVLSDSWQVELQKRLGAQHFCVIANGVPIIDCFPGNKCTNREVNILFLGNLTERKGVLDLLEVMRYVDNAVLHMVGGEEQVGIVAKANQIINQFQLNSKVKLHGVKSGHDKRQFLVDADIFVLPSYAEGLPVSLLEAMAYGLPVIVSTVGGIPAVVTDEKEGFLISAGDQQQLRLSLNRLINDPALRDSMGQAARARCQAGFGIDNTVDKLLNLYRDIYPESQDFEQ